MGSHRFNKIGNDEKLIIEALSKVKVDISIGYAPKWGLRFEKMKEHRKKSVVVKKWRKLQVQFIRC